MLPWKDRALYLTRFFKEHAVWCGNHNAKRSIAKETMWEYCTVLGETTADDHVEGEA